MSQHSSSFQPIYRLLRFCLFAGLALWFKSLFISLVYALFFSLLLLPMARRFELIKIPRGIAAFLSIFLYGSIVVLVLSILGNQLYALAKELPALGMDFNRKLDQIQQLIFSYTQIEPGQQITFLKQTATNLLRDGMGVMNTLSNTVSVLFDFLLVPFFAFFFLLYRSGLKKFLLLITPSDLDDSVLIILDKVQSVTRGYLKGMLIVMLIVALLNSIGLWVLRVEYALLFGVVAAISSIVPYLGMLIGGGLAILFVWLTKEPMWYPLACAGLFYAVQLLADNVLTPRITGSSVSVNALAATFSLIVGGIVFGPSGMILAIPFIAVVKVYCDNMPGLRGFGFLLGEELRARE